MSGIPIIGLSAKTYDPIGSITVSSPTTPKELPLTRRTTRTATLDGGCSVYDGGCTPADSIVKISVKPAKTAIASTIRHIVESHTRVVIALPGGCYEASPESVEVTGDEVRATFLIVEELSA